MSPESSRRWRPTLDGQESGGSRVGLAERDETRPWRQWRHKQEGGLSMGSKSESSRLVPSRFPRKVHRIEPYGNKGHDGRSAT